MSFDIRIGTTKTYSIPVRLNKETHGINAESYQQTIPNSYSINATKKLIQKDSGSFVFSGEVSGQLTDKVSVTNVSLPLQDNLYYLVKHGSMFTYTKEKPFEFDSRNLQASIQQVYNPLQAHRGLIYSSSSHMPGYPSSIKHSFPYGGISQGTLKLGYILDGYRYDLDTNAVTVDYLEGAVYVDTLMDLDYIIGYFDIEPIEIHSSDYQLVDGNSGSLYCTPTQKGLSGDITVEPITTNRNSGYAVSFSYSVYIVPSDPYFIKVDGVPLQTPRYVPKDTLILVEQDISDKIDSFTSHNIQLFNTGDNYEMSSLSTTLMNNSQSLVEVFDKDKTSAGLFIYREVDRKSYTLAAPTYLPLFNAQTLIKEITDE